MSDNSAKNIERPSISPTPQPAARQTSAGFMWLLLGIGLGVAMTLASSRLLQPAAEAPIETASAPVGQAAPIPVTLATVTATPIQQTVEATGTVVAAELLAVLSPNSGLQIQQVLVEAGDLVTQGQVLAILDGKVLQAQVRAAEAEVRAAEAKLADLQAGSRVEELERARAEVRSTEANIARAESDLTLAAQRAQRHQTLAREGAIASDRLDELLNQARSAEADLAQSKALWQQALQQLSELEVGPRPERLAEAAAQLDASRQRVQTLQAQLADTRVLAPRSGKIAERLARVGDLASGKLFSIIDRHQLELHLEVPELQLSSIRPQQGTWVTSDAHPNLRLAGRVQRIEPLIDPKTRMAIVKVSLPASASLQSGMFLRGAIITSAHQGLTLPAESVLPQPDGSSITYRFNPDQTVTAQRIEVGELLPNQRIEVKRGLARNDRVIMKGAAYLKEGDRVEVN